MVALAEVSLDQALSDVYHGQNSPQDLGWSLCEGLVHVPGLAGDAQTSDSGQSGECPPAPARDVSTEPLRGDGGDRLCPGTV